MPFTAAVSLTSDLRAAVDGAIKAWEAGGNTKRLWARDASLWTNSGEDKWLGWLDIIDSQLADPGRFQTIASDVQAAGFTDAVVLGMGGSSLCPDVLSKTFGQTLSFPRLHVLDSTVPAQVLALERRVNLGKTLFIVASKSGSTLEPSIFLKYFYERCKHNGAQFYAITDPGSKLQASATQDGFAKVFFGIPEIGGRFSAMSDFGMVPAAVMGMDVVKLLNGAQQMVEACMAESTSQNPGVEMGIVMGTLANLGRNKLTILSSPKLSSLGAWQEQLVAESTGKVGKGIIPVDGEPLIDPAHYGPDRLFVYQRLEGDDNDTLDAFAKALADAGQPVIRIPLRNRHQLGAEFFRWEIATAVAGSVIGIDAFNQPDVEFSKVEARKLTTAFEETGKLPEEAPALEEDGIKLYGDTKAATLAGALAAHFSDIQPLKVSNDHVTQAGYVALLAYIEMTDAHQARLQAMRQRILEKTRAATCVGFGPRFLHSTGQAYKGGPAGGLFLQITSDDAEDAPVPGQKYSFGIVKAAQAQGDLEVLRSRGRRSLRIHLGADVTGGLKKLALAVDHALQ